MNEASHWNEKWDNRPPEPPNNFARRALQLIKNRKLDTLLDLGCGKGRDSIYFSRKGLNVTAVDFSENGITHLRSQNPEINCICSDIRKMGFAENTFDIIYAHLSLHYFDDCTTRQIFYNLYGIMRENGLLFVKCKSIEDTLFGQGEKVGDDMYLKEHLRHFFSREYMAEQLDRFKIIKIRKNSSVYHGYKSAFIEAIASKQKCF